MTTTTADTDVAVVRAASEAIAKGDLVGFRDQFHADATWNHRGDDRLSGVHQGSDGILAFITEAVRLTGGTLRPVPLSFLTDGEGQVAVLTGVSGTRPDGRSFDDRQVLLFTIYGGRVRSVDQFIGDPKAVAAFWA
jgi:ketosteroid isomerase-like protein